VSTDPIRQFLAHLNATTIFNLDLGTVDDSVLLALTPCLIDNGNLGVPIHDDPFTLFILDRNPGVIEVGILLGSKLMNLMVPACFASVTVCSTTLLAVPPMWNVRMVSCVPAHQSTVPL